MRKDKIVTRKIHKHFQFYCNEITRQQYVYNILRVLVALLTMIYRFYSGFKLRETVSPHRLCGIGYSILILFR